MGWRRLHLEPLAPQARTHAESPASPSASRPTVEVSAEERAALRTLLAERADRGAVASAGAGADRRFLDDAAAPVTAAALDRLLDEIERQRCIAFTGTELVTLLPFLTRLRARCRAARSGGDRLQVTSPRPGHATTRHAA